MNKHVPTDLLDAVPVATPHGGDRSKSPIGDLRQSDAAQERGEVARGRPKTIPDGNTLQATAADVGLSAKEIHEAREIRDAVQAAAEFDWLEDEDVCIPEQQGIAVYEAKDGDIIIRQQRAWCDDEDSIIAVKPDNLQKLIDKLCDLAGIPGVP